MPRRRRSGLEQVRRTMYYGQRGIGDAQAMRRGPGHYVRRVARRSLVAAFFRAMR